MTIYHVAKGICLHCGYPQGTHRTDCSIVVAEVESELFENNCGYATNSDVKSPQLSNWNPVAYSLSQQLSG